MSTEPIREFDQPPVGPQCRREVQPRPRRWSLVVPLTSRPPLSVLDLAIVNANASSADALRAATQLCAHADQSGYRRFWVAEHHNMASVASTSPPVLMAHLAASTERIRVGSGGIMLPNHPPLVVAEHIAALEALHPDRIDLGIGRAPGTDPRTAAALRRSPAGLSVEDFPRDLLAVMGLLGDPRTEGDDGLWERFRATPAATSFPQIWLLGSSGYSAQLAGLLGLRFAFAHHFGTGGTLEAAELYRRSFRPSPVLDAPHLLVTANVLVARSTEEAAFEAGPGRLMSRGIRTGQFTPLVPPAEAADQLGSESAVPDRPGRLVGTADLVVAGLDRLAQDTEAAEIMVSTVAHDLDVRRRSLTLLAEAWSA